MSTEKSDKVTNAAAASGRDHTEWLLEYCNDLINSHQNVSHQYKIRSIILAILGVLLSAFCFIPQLGLREQVPDWMKIGPALVMLPLSSYQYMSMLASSKDLTSYLFYKRKLGYCLESGADPPDWLADAIKRKL